MVKNLVRFAYPGIFCNFVCSKSGNATVIQRIAFQLIVHLLRIKKKEITSAYVN